MNDQVFPTKGNLINTKKSLALAKLGYELLDRKRNILIREMMTLIEKAKSIRGSIEGTYIQAYSALQKANITLGVITNVAESVPVENGIHISYRSVMGVEIPEIKMDEQPLRINYGFSRTNSQLDIDLCALIRLKSLQLYLLRLKTVFTGWLSESRKHKAVQMH